MSKTTTKIPEVVHALRTAGVLRELDYCLVEAVLRLQPDLSLPEDAVLALALASRAVGEGHVCLDLDQLTLDWVSGLLPKNGTVLPSADKLDAYCGLMTDASRRKTWAFADAAAGFGPEGAGPFVLEGHRLYLRRFYHYERLVATRLVDMAAGGAGDSLPEDTRQRLEALLPAGLQRVAAECALTRRLTLISGGPGTGKTYTAVRILALLSQGRGADARPLRIRLAAPTGKAAARLGESIREARAAAAQDVLPETVALHEACTLDRLLGTIQGSPYFRHHRGHPLEADVVILDEASMIDLARMAKLLDALAPETRLVLLGDRYQLAAVRPGSVLAELCSAPVLATSVVELTDSHRFEAGGGIARFSAAVNAADSSTAAAELLQNAHGEGAGDAGQHDIRVAHVPAMLIDRQGEIHREFARQIRAGYREFLAASTPEAAFAALGRFRVLCALRRGPLGVEQVNAVIERVLASPPPGDDATTGSAPPPVLEPTVTFYDHRVVMVTCNDYATGLYNGDIGIVLPDPEHEGVLQVCFEKKRPDSTESRYRQVSCHLLPAHETAFAMTIHKSQGSEFDHVLILLPLENSPVLTRELIYTAVTRTRGSVSLWANPETFSKGVQRSVRRFTGLGDQLQYSMEGL